ncbi:MAG: TonB family protein, partial [Bacteroidetes bacterium]
NIEDPAFYFDPEEDKAAQARDYLLMTAGWRRFTWREVASGIQPPRRRSPQKTVMQGSLRDLQGLPIAGAEVRIADQVTHTDAGGNWQLPKVWMDQHKQLRMSLPDSSVLITRHLTDYESDLHVRLAEVRGRVLDTAGRAMPGAMVAMLGTSQRGMADAKGAFILPLALTEAGPPRMVATYPGYIPDTLEMAFSSGKSVVEFSLEEEDRPIVARPPARRQVGGRIVQAGAGPVLEAQPENVPVAELPQDMPPRSELLATEASSAVIEQAEEEFAEGGALVVEKSLAHEALMEAPNIGFGNEIAPGNNLLEADIMVDDIMEAKLLDVVVMDAEAARQAPDMDAFFFGDEEPEPINLAQIRQGIGYPRLAREAGIEGTVVVRMLVDEKGHYKKHQMIVPGHPLLADAVTPMLPGLAFTPGIQGGRPRSCWVNIPFRFRLDDPEMSNRPVMDITPPGGWQQPVARYYRARDYPVQRYGAGARETLRREDFRQTLHWDGLIETDERGEAEVRFFTSDALTAFHITVEGIGMDGLAGRATHTFFSQLPLEMDVRMPALLTAYDSLEVPVTLVNHAPSTLRGQLTVDWPANLIPLAPLPGRLTLKAGEATTLYLPCRVDTIAGMDSLRVRFQSQGFGDAMTVPVQSRLRGFPAQLAFSGDSRQASYLATIPDLVPGSLRARLVAHPSVAGEVMEGLEGMLREPHGCFEQTSSTTYPNVLVLNYLKETGQAKPALQARAEALIATGYARLMTFETSEGGFEWFGQAPGHEALTAYGLMEFADMARVYDGVAPDLISRTADWLLARRDGAGGFKRNPRALHQFGLADEVTTSVYITYALSEAGILGIEREVEYAVKQAQRRGTPYLLALAANTLINQGRSSEANPLLADLKALPLTEPPARDEATWYTAPGSGGQARQIEVNALAMMALMRAEQPDWSRVAELEDWLRRQRSGVGTFGSTHSTVLALRALVAYAKRARWTPAAGSVTVLIDGEAAGKAHFGAAEQEAVVIEGLEAALGVGSHKLEVIFSDRAAVLPYTLALDWVTDLPPTSPGCAVRLSPRLARQALRMGETVRLDLDLENTQKVGQGMTMAIVGLPAGLSAQPWQLEALLDEEQVAFYELVGQELYLYFRQMAPGERRQLGLDLKAEVPGTFVGQASRGYLYYTDEHKDWQMLPPVTIRR